ncbi:MAG TPA: N(4)-(beta-N-acetylglucosaminyl)-L-asparaginase, partial [Firmicutes bacterium]|nr:N(4)-(beta-N-acetylglucosaminyl)-L-asparaginase [Bacillota bacterium]
MWGIIGTWEMAYDGIKEGARILKEQGHVFDALETCVRMVEDCDKYSSVGYGGLPN